MITVRSVVGGVVKALREVFPDCEVYTEEVEQGLEPPCFSVVCAEPSISRIVGKRFFRKFDICVYYYPECSDVFSESGDIWDKSILALELINVDGDLIRGTDFSSKIVDGVLVICVSFGTFVYDNEKAPAMGSVKLTHILKQ